MAQKISFDLLHMNIGVLVSSCYCNKLPQTWWLKTAVIYLLTALEARSLE